MFSADEYAVVATGMPKDEDAVVVAGGGVAGLTVALALKQVGRRAVILESRPNLDQVGSGINVQPAAVQALVEHCDIPLKKLVAAGHVVRTQSYYTRDGRLVVAIDKGSAKIPQVSIHRTALHGVLVDAMTSQGIELYTGQKSVGYTERDGTVVVHTKSGAEFAGTALIGCDGIHSKLAPLVSGNPQESELRHSGVVIFRGVARRRQPFLDGRTMVLVGDTKLKLVAYAIKQHADGTHDLNWVIETDLGANAASPTADYRATVPYSSVFEAIAAVGSLSVDFLDIEEMIRVTPAIGCWPMADRVPMPSWTRGRVALTGDAAHPMLPVGSAGATSAILDGAAVADAFAAAEREGWAGDVPRVLRTFEAARLETVHRIQVSCHMMACEMIVEQAEAAVPFGAPVPERYGERIRATLKRMQSGSK